MTNILLISEYDKICRTCLKSNQTLMSLFKAEILNMFSICTLINIKENDGFPNQICALCFQRVTDAYNFYKQCANSDQLLRETQLSQIKQNHCENLINQETSAKEQNVIESVDPVDDVQDVQTFNDLKDEEGNSNDGIGSMDDDDNVSSDGNDDDDNDSEDDERTLQEMKNDKHHYGEKKESESAWKKALQLGPDKCDPTTKTCKICNKVLYNVHSLVRHVETHDENRKYVAMCEICNKGFYEKQHMTNHMLRHKGEARYECEECKKPFYELCAMRLHFKRKHCDKKVVCMQCDQKFYLQHDLDIHMKTTHNKEQYQCPDCGKTFRFRFRMKDHQWMHAKERIFHCRQCDKSFKSKQVLQLHYKRVHSGERKREVCNICGKSVVYLKTHLSIHNNEKYNCNDCGREFRNKYSLEKHIKRKHGNMDEATLNPYLCNICGKRSENLRMLNRHFLTHTDARPHKCSVCGKHFKTADRRDNHVKHTHNNVRDYKCSYCSKCFHTKSGLTIHIRVHTGERPYSCKLCGKAFQQRSTLRTHMKVHGLHTNNGVEQITRNIEVHLSKT